MDITSTEQSMSQRAVASREDLRKEYDPIYSRFFLETENIEELPARKNFMNTYLLSHPMEIFDLDNKKTQRYLLDLLDTHYKEGYPDQYRDFLNSKEYQRYKRDRQLTTRYKVGSTAPVTIIALNSTLPELVNLYRIPHTRKTLDRFGFWEKKLEQLNTEDSVDYGKILKLGDIKRTVLAVMGIKELIPFVDPIDLEIYVSRPTVIDYVKAIYRSNWLFLDYSKSPQKILTLPYILPHLVNLRTLYIENIQELPPNFSQGPSGLTGLSIMKTTIKIIPKGTFSNLKLLTNLVISENPYLIELPRNAFSGLQYLELLNLRMNRITTIEEGTFNGLDRLKQLDLDNNRMVAITKGMFIGMPNLLRLDMSTNQIETIENGSFNQVPPLTLFAPSRQRGHLQRLDLHDNKINTVHKDTFIGLDQLVYLDLSANYIKNINGEIFNILKHLEILNLSDNEIKNITEDTFMGLDSLQKLDLSSNQIRDIKKGTFSRIPHLQVLNLHNNDITTIVSKTFPGMNQLSHIDLSSNVIKTIKYGAFLGAPNLEIVDLRKNKINYRKKISGVRIVK